jgi:hypothetical protein
MLSSKEHKACRECGGKVGPLRIAHRDYLCSDCNNRKLREWTASHPDQVRSSRKSRNARLRAAKPEWALWAAAKQRARNLGLPFDIEVSDVVIPPRCPVLGVPLKRKSNRGGGDASPSLDRIVPERGYVKGNIAVISNKANRIKSNATPEELDRVSEWLRSVLRGECS